jgi:lipopolysaccharide transport system ATP-binding protein
LNANFERIEVVNIGQPITLKIQYKIHEAISGLTIGFVIKDRLGQHVFGTNTHHLNHAVTNLEPLQSALCEFSFAANFGVGNYSIAVALHSGDSHILKNYEWRDLAVVFNVVNQNKPDSVGICWVPVTVAEKVL